MEMKPPAGSPSAELVGTMPTETLANREARLRTTLATLERCRAELASDAEHETADLLSLAILQLRMKLKGVTDSEPKLLCDLHAAEEQARMARARAPRGRRRRGAPPFVLVK